MSQGYILIWIKFRALNVQKKSCFFYQNALHLEIKSLVTDFYTTLSICMNKEHTEFFKQILNFYFRRKVAQNW